MILHFIQKILNYARAFRSRSHAQQQELDAFISTLPSMTSSPLWRLKVIDAHQDTPVEILHTILLGFVKYFWRDAIKNTSSADHDVLAIRLSSLDVAGLHLDTSALSGKTLVQYAGSLVGRDFRVIVQVAPFVLYDLVPQECFDTWLALSALVPLVWQPSIKDLNKHVVSKLIYIIVSNKDFI